MGSSLLDKMLKTGSVKQSDVLSDSKFFGVKEVVPTDLPILNIAFGGSLTGGLIPGLTIFAGKSKSFKSLLGLYCMKAYLDKYPEGIALMYDSEFGITPEYLEANHIDTSRVVHIPITDVEDLKFDIVKKLKAIEDGEKVFILIDSIGNLASKKEVEDADNEKSVADMSRAKSLKSLTRIITPHLTLKNIPCIAINHVYDELSMYPKAIVSGGTGLVYSSNQIFIISKSQEKDNDGLNGFTFTITIEKSRFVKERSKLPFKVLFKTGIQKWSALFELAEEAGYITKVNKGWYSIIDPETGEVDDNKRRQKEIEQDNQFFQTLIKNKDFNEFVEKKFKLSGVMDEGQDINDMDDFDDVE